VISFGDYVKDQISKLEGYVVAECTYLHSCKHLGIQSKAVDGVIPPVQWVDEPQVIMLRRDPPRMGMNRETGERGGPMPHPPDRR